MQVDVYLYNFDKRINSTKRPEGEGKALSLVWEQPYDEVTPTFLLHGAELEGYNFAYIPQFGRYYWISVERYRNEKEIAAKCRCDVLATYRPQISASTQFVELSETNFNTLYNDRRLASMATTRKASNSVVMDGISTNSCAQFYLEAIGSGGSGTFTDKYIVLPSNVGQLAEKALTDPDIIKESYNVYTDFISQHTELPGWLGKISNGALIPLITAVRSLSQDEGLDASKIDDVVSGTIERFTDWWSDVWGAVQERFKNPWECIVTLKGLALSSTQIFDTSSITTIKLGVTDSQIAARMLQDTLSRELTCTIEIPWQYSDFRNLSPYTEVNIIMPNCGVQAVSPDLIYGAQSITARYRINATTGDVVGYLETDSGIKFSDFTFNIATPVNVSAAYGTAGFGWTGKAVDVIQTLAGVLGGDSNAGGTGLSNLIMPTKFTVSMKGTTQTCALLDNQMRVEVIANNTQDPSSLSKLGRICRKVLQIGSLSGYIQCENASISLQATMQEIEEVNNYLNGGFYFE